MLRALGLAMAILVLPWKSAAAASPDLGANAALMYWQAFAQLPKFTDAEQTKLSAECLTMPLDAMARALVKRSAYALRMMHRGAALRRCAWAIPWKEEGIGALAPHAMAARVLSSLACLRARLRFAEGQSAAAVDDLIAALALGRHASRDGSLIMVLVGYAIEHQVGEALALNLPKLKTRAIKDLKKRLDALPPGGTPALAMRDAEIATLDWFIRKVKEAKDLKRALAFLGPLCARKGESPEKVGRDFLRKCGGTAKGVLQFAEETRPSYRRMAKALDLPLDQFAKAFEREKKKQAKNPVYMLFPAVNKMRVFQLRADVRRALLAAALDVRLEDKGALKKHPDPAVGGPFQYVAFKGGFELRSKWKLDDQLRSKWKLDKRLAKPLTLTVGRRGK
jgi:hypothetical protein